MGDVNDGIGSAHACHESRLEKPDAKIQLFAKEEKARPLTTVWENDLSTHGVRRPDECGGHTEVCNGRLSLSETTALEQQDGHTRDTRMIKIGDLWRTTAGVENVASPSIMQTIGVVASLNIRIRPSISPIRCSDRIRRTVGNLRLIISDVPSSGASSTKMTSPGGSWACADSIAVCAVSYRFLVAIPIMAITSSC
jgi:hypothetical protein